MTSRAQTPLMRGRRQSENFVSIKKLYHCCVNKFKTKTSVRPNKNHKHCKSLAAEKKRQGKETFVFGSQHFKKVNK